MKWFLMAVICLGGAFVLFQMEQEKVRKTEKEFQQKIIEVNNHKFEVPDLPDKMPNSDLSEEDLKKYKKALHSSSFGVKMEAFSKLLNAQDASVIPAMKKVIARKYEVCYGSQCEDVSAQKMAVISLISSSQSKASMEMLEMAAKDKNKNVRAAAVRALGEYLSQDVLAPLDEAKKDRDKDIRENAEQSYEKIFKTIEDWKREQRSALIEEYARKAATSSYEKAEQKFNMLADAVSANHSSAKGL